jgi:agmatine/peptidylarginine deiminase
MKRFIAEFEKQSFTQIIFPHSQTDWLEYLDDAIKNYIEIINAIIRYQKCLVICNDIDLVKSYFTKNENLYFIEYNTDDTWARDCSSLCIYQDQELKLLDFKFNGWGDKFESSKDNAMSKSISKYYSQKLESIEFILEGGAIDGNGDDAILTTSKCLFNKNRNAKLTPLQITKKINQFFGVTKIFYLEHGYLDGDDTDSHIDTLARFIDNKTIMYISCRDKRDKHYVELKLMEDELKEIALDNNYNLISLPMTEAIYYKNERLPATYANFLFVNGAVLVPIYGVKEDEEAIEVFRDTFRDKDIVPIDCSTLIKQHGSLHCITMNFASGVSILI